MTRLALSNKASCLGDTNILPETIKAAIAHIKSKKSDGVYDFMSDHFINAPDILCLQLSRLLSSCLCHGYIPHCLLLSTLVPIPKEQMGDLTTSNNYRGIALCALIMKIFEYVFLNNHPDSFASNENQFAYKKKSSTTDCTWVAREVISYYTRNGSNVFACFLDCSKAFDKIRFDILFDKLISKGVSPILIRFLMYSYMNSTVRVRWNGAYSDVFNVVNGVRQGAVLSPFLFNIYTEDLISKLKLDGKGCWVGSEYYGALLYADDILLLAPSVSALQCMVLKCEIFGKKNGIDFNLKKYVCINFHLHHECLSSNTVLIKLNGAILSWSLQVKYLGHTLSCCGDFEKDINIKKGQFIACVNNINTEFSFSTPCVKMKLLSAYGTSFYGSNLWNLYGKAAKTLYTSWNIAIRRTLKIPYRTHTRYLNKLSGLHHIHFTLKRRFINFIQRLFMSDNLLIKNMLHYTTSTCLSPTGCTLSRIIQEFDVFSFTHIHWYLDNLSKIMLDKYIEKSNLSATDTVNCNVVQEMMNCLQGSNTCVLSLSECAELLEFVAVS